MRIAEVKTQADWTFLVTADDGRVGQFDLRPYLQYEAFEELNDIGEFMKIKNGGYFVEWECGADLSADTIEAKMRIAGRGGLVVGLNPLSNKAMLDAAGDDA